MAEASYLWDNPGTGDSPALGYGNSLLCQVIFRMLFNGTGDQGVLRLWENELEVTDGGVDTATVDTGAAFAYGVWYENTSAVNININAYRGGNCLIVARAVWATQTVRVVARAVGALTQNPGVTYEIPLANVAIDGAGAITLITDTRDYCEFSTILPDGAIETDALQADAVTTAKMIDQDRWLTRGAGQCEADATNPAAWEQQSWDNKWTFTQGADEYFWLTFRVPTDISSANMEVYLYDGAADPGAGDVRWTYNLFQAAAAGVLANASGAVVVSYLGTGPQTWYCPNYTLLITRAVTAGDIVHLRIGREGTHVTDTLAHDAILFLVRVEYTADS